MTTADAIKVCEEWFAHLERSRRRAIQLQEAANMARAGHHEEARRMRRQIDTASLVVYDGARLEPAVRHLITVIADAA